MSLFRKYLVHKGGKSGITFGERTEKKKKKKKKKSGRGQRGNLVPKRVWGECLSKQVGCGTNINSPSNRTRVTKTRGDRFRGKKKNMGRRRKHSPTPHMKTFSKAYWGEEGTSGGSAR